MGLVNLVPKKGVEIPKIYQMDRFICLAAQHVIVYDEKYRHLNIEKSNYSAVIKILSRGTYYVDNFGVYRKGNETVGEIPPGSQFDDPLKRLKGILVLLKILIGKEESLRLQKSLSISTITMLISTIKKIKNIIL